MKPLIVHPSAYTRLKARNWETKRSGKYLTLELIIQQYLHQCALIDDHENELRIAITAVLKGLNQLHSRGMPDYLLFVQFLPYYVLTLLHS